VAAAAVVADTHVLVWYVAGQPLSQPALDALDGATAASEPIYISAITLLEIVYLAESQRLTAEQVRLVDEALQAEDSAFEIYAVDERAARTVAEVPRADPRPPGPPHRRDRARARRAAGHERSGAAGVCFGTGSSWAGCSRRPALRCLAAAIAQRQGWLDAHATERAGKPTCASGSPPAPRNSAIRQPRIAVRTWCGSSVRCRPPLGSKGTSSGPGSPVSSRATRNAEASTPTGSVSTAMSAANWQRIALAIEDAEVAAVVMSAGKNRAVGVDPRSQAGGLDIGL
jgi:PIN domain nuclease of toxin-antitoxin system